MKLTLDEYFHAALMWLRNGIDFKTREEDPDYGLQPFVRVTYQRNREEFL